jgi:hypothetical protein
VASCCSVSPPGEPSPVTHHTLLEADEWYKVRLNRSFYILLYSPKWWAKWWPLFMEIIENNENSKYSVFIYSHGSNQLTN